MFNYSSPKGRPTRVLPISPPLWALCSVLLGLSAATSLHAQSIVINEIMASNSAAIRDEDGDSPDWIELFNPTQGPIDLDGFGLSDDPDEPFKWVFPELSLEPQAFLLVFASGKGRREWLQWETVIDWGDQWRYRRGTSHPPSDWRDVEFDDSSWSRGPSGFGYADGDDATLVPPSFSVVARKTFTIADRSTVSAALLHVDYDDAFVAYLNGVEIARANIGVVGDRPVFIETALTDREAQMYQGGEPVEFLLRDAGSLIRDGRNLLAIQVHNVGIGSSDMSLIPFLTIGFRSPPSASSRGLSRHLGSTVNHLHTNFRINADGENLTLYHANGELLDVIDAGKLPPDVSLGRQPDGGAGWVLFGQSTPGAANTTDGFESVGGELSFSHLPGFHPGPFMLVLSAGEPHAAIYYTLDGSQPSQDSNLYQLPIPIRRTTAVRARALAPNAIPGKAISHTYLVNESITLPVVSLATDPANLWDPDSGIYVLGREYEPNQPHFGANFWEDWERPVHVEFFEPAGELGFALDAGMKIFGGWSRDHPQKSLSIFARSRYGAGEIDYQLFPDKPITGFESIVLRNSGNDWLSTLFRDGMMQGLLQDTDVDTQAYRPAVVFLNGVYWGILNIREKISEHFLAANRGVDPDNLDLLEFDGSVIHGDNAHYRAMMDYIARHNIHLPATLDSIRTMMDIDNFLDYQIAQIYFDNTDWPGNNIKYWRPRTPDGRWKWIVFDTDFGFGLWDPARYRFDTLEFAMEGNGPGWPNPPWSTYLLRKFLFNGSFRNEFINRFADHLNATFHPDRANRRIDEISGDRGRDIPKMLHHYLEKRSYAKALDFLEGRDETAAPNC